MFHFSKSLNAILIGGVSGNQSLTSKRILLIGSRWILPPTVQLNVSKVMTPLIQTKGLNEIIFKIINSSNRVILFYDFSSYDFALKLKNLNTTLTAELFFHNFSNFFFIFDLNVKSSDGNLVVFFLKLGKIKVKKMFYRETGKIK